uniref:Uncharacterized protein n=1 Tax=Picea glauca TaxID=3330 RepID=A0A101LWB8_PICGL|nr:hypothetical protein ABT39_MTgene1854 [Picea glauca]
MIPLATLGSAPFLFTAYALTGLFRKQRMHRLYGRTNLLMDVYKSICDLREPLTFSPRTYTSYSLHAAGTAYYTMSLAPSLHPCLSFCCSYHGDVTLP